MSGIKNDTASCQPPTDPAPFQDENSLGINPPSVTAEPLMETEGYTAPESRPGNPAPAADDTDAHATDSMHHTDEFRRAVPKQHRWPL